MVKLSERMKAVADLVPKSETLADIGCDHGYLPIHLVEQGVVLKAIAMDINPGPLQAAKEHIAEMGLGDRIITRLSDGLDKLKPGEGESIIIAGMGGRLIIRILQDALPFLKGEGGVRSLILQPQSELAYFRQEMRAMGFVCEREDMVYEDGKFYPMGRYSLGDTSKSDKQELFDLYGPLLLKEKHPVLLKYLQKEAKILEGVAASLSNMKDGEEKSQRQLEVAEKLKMNQTAQNLY